jgi:hypothetical protein
MFSSLDVHALACCFVLYSYNYVVYTYIVMLYSNVCEAEYYLLGYNAV